MPPATRRSKKEFSSKSAEGGPHCQHPEFGLPASRTIEYISAVGSHHTSVATATGNRHNEELCTKWIRQDLLVSRAIHTQTPPDVTKEETDSLTYEILLRKKGMYV